MIGGADALAVDFSNGDPLPAGGLVYSGGTYVTPDNLFIQGASSGDAVLANADGITVNGSAPITYSNVQSFSFNLGGGQDGLTVDGIAFPAGGSLAISDGTAVTVQGGGTLDLGGNTYTAGGVTLIEGSLVDGTLFNSGSQVVQSGTVSAGLAGSADLLKNTGGTVTLSGTNTFTGGTTVNEGLLVVANSAAILGGSMLSIGGNGSLVLGNPSSFELGNMPGGGTLAAAVPATSRSDGAVPGNGSGSAVEPAIARTALGSVAVAGPGIVHPLPTAAAADGGNTRHLAIQSVLARLSPIQALGLSELACAQSQQRRHKPRDWAQAAVDATLVQLEWPAARPGPAPALLVPSSGTR